MPAGIVTDGYVVHIPRKWVVALAADAEAYAQIEAGAVCDQL
jgi:hypothetical protein